MFSLFHRSRDERGAVVLMTALFTVVILGIAALAVDLGMQRVVRRDMQALADVVALDMARDLNQGKTKAEVLADPTWAAHLAQSIARNSTTLGDAPAVAAFLGTVDSGGVFAESANDEVPTAVKVTSQSAVNFAFISGRGGAMRSAVATANPPRPTCPVGDPTCTPPPATEAKACFKIGSWAARLDSGNSYLLNRLVGGALKTGVIGYDGLATSTLTLGELSSQMGFATPDQLMSASVKVTDWLSAVASILNRHGDAANGDLVASIRQTVLSANVVNQQIQLGAHANAAGREVGLFDLGTGGDSGLNTKLTALDIVAASAFIANGTSAIDVPVSLNLPNVGTTTARVTVIQAPQVYCGPLGTQGSTSQVTVSVDTAVIPTVPGGFSVVAADSRVTATLDLASATGTLTNILCSNEPTVTTPEGIDVAVHYRGVAASTVANLKFDYSGLQVSGLTSPLLGLLGIDTFHGVATVSVTATSSALEGDTAPVPTFRSPDNYDEPFTTEYSGPVLTAPSVVTVAAGSGTTEIGAILGALTGGSNEATVDAAIAQALNASLTTNFFSGVVDGVNNNLLSDLSDLTGIKLGGTDVWAVPRPTCQGPVLVG